jgi:signal transduction histidine kinase
LGLATSYGIIEDHGGKIFVKSKVREGTTFTIELPTYLGNRTGSEEKPPILRPIDEGEERVGS